mmetsp:Transcript_37520/g.67878  ORF Transcript_37520/g.67878 Transcript_37520/m.67878 type:complete len:140 (-) Transcript_37520:79-498(-)
MAMTGVTVADECTEKFNEMKLKKTNKFITFKIENKKTVVIDVMGESGKTMQDFRDALPDSEARYALIDVDYTSEDGRPQTKLTFVFWCNDDTVPVREKMLYAGTKDAIKKKFPGIMKELQANSPDELEDEAIFELMLKK